MPKPSRKYSPRTMTAMSREEVAQKLGLTVQEVRWAEESALRKMKLEAKAHPFNPNRV